MNIVTLNSTSQLLDIYRYRLGSSQQWVLLNVLQNL